MSYLESPEDKSKDWLLKTIKPYGGKLKNHPEHWKGMRITFGNRLRIDLSGITFNGSTFCLEGKDRRTWNYGKTKLPTHDWLISAFYTAISDAGCTRKRKTRTHSIHNDKSCRRCSVARRIRLYLEERKNVHG